MANDKQAARLCKICGSTENYIIHVAETILKGGDVGQQSALFQSLTQSLARVRGLLQRQWISVEERLPDDFMQCLIFGHGPDDEGFEVGQIMEAGYNMDGEWLPHREMEFPITHWMPMPDLPTFPQSSSLVPSGAESADIGKLDSADESGKVNKGTCPTCKRPAGYVIGSINESKVRRDNDDLTESKSSSVTYPGSAETGGERRPRHD